MAASILIVEDSETQALQLAWLLEKNGWEVFRASCGESAVKELNRHLPALMIVDYHLPGIAGDELCRKVRMNIHTRGIPILMLTGDDSFGSEPAGLDSGADDYVSKSVAPEILLLRVRALLRGSGERTSGLSPQEAYFRRARILAIDDSPTWLESLVIAFGSEGYEVVTATGAEERPEPDREGVFRLRHCRPDHARNRWNRNVSHPASSEDGAFADGSLHPGGHADFRARPKAI